MFYKKSLWLSLVVNMVIWAGCSSNVEFGAIPPVGGYSGNPTLIVQPPNTPADVTQVYNLNLTQFAHQQAVYPKNIITAQYQVMDANNLTINGLGKDKFKITENGVAVTNFDLTQQNTGFQQDADIVVVLDVTTSMDSSIDKVKNKIGSFVDALAKSNIRARLCLVQFTDNVEKVCDKFVENDPNTPQNENYDDFVKKLKAISTHDGGSESDEGQLAALEAAAQKTPWHNGAQKVAILVSDAGFHYFPGNDNEGKYVPNYDHTLSILKSVGMQTFVISIFKPGYDRDFGTSPSMTAATGGVFYNLRDILSGLTDMADIFKNIAGNLLTAYTATYSVDDNPGLDPSLPFAQRGIQIALDPGIKGAVKILGITSSLVNGHPQSLKKFEISSKDIWESSVKVQVDHVALSSGFKLTKKEIEFDLSPAQSALIEVAFHHADMREDTKFSPILYKTTFAIDLKKLEITANGIKLSASQFSAKTIDSKTLYLDLDDSLFSAAADPVEIRKRGLLVLEFILK